MDAAVRNHHVLWLELFRKLFNNKIFYIIDILCKIKSSNIDVLSFSCINFGIYMIFYKKRSLYRKTFPLLLETKTVIIFSLYHLIFCKI